MSINLNDFHRILLLSFPIALITGPLLPELIILISIFIYFLNARLKKFKEIFQIRFSCFY